MDGSSLVRTLQGEAAGAFAHALTAKAAASFPHCTLMLTLDCSALCSRAGSDLLARLSLRYEGRAHAETPSTAVSEANDAEAAVETHPPIPIWLAVPLTADRRSG